MGLLGDQLKSCHVRRLICKELVSLSLRVKTTENLPTALEYETRRDETSGQEF
jgi:hypothetical protein